MKPKTRRQRILSGTMAQKKSPEKRTGRLLFTGFSMGFADLIPGVSSGTIAFLYGIYDELLYTIRTLTGALPKLLFKGKFRQAFALIPYKFLIPLGIGMVIAIFGMVQVVSYLLDTQALYVWAVFFGLVLGSALVISKRMRGWTINRGLLLLAGFGLTFFVVGLPTLASASSPLLTLGTGAIASMAMILPGISGSLMMVLLGQYENIITAISNLDLVTLAIFAGGIIIGLALFARLLGWLLHHHHSAVIATLIGVMLGSLRAVWPWQAEASANAAPTFDSTFIFVVSLMAAGFIIVILLERFGIAKEHNDIDSKEFKRELTTQQD